MEQRILILEKKGLYPMSNIPHILLQKHFLQQEISAKCALGLSKQRGQNEDHLIYNTVFEKPSELWKCVVIRDNSGLVNGEKEVYISERKLQTYQCYRKPYKANEWIADNIGKNYAIFGTDYSDYHFIEESLNADSVEIREDWDSRSEDSGDLDESEESEESIDSYDSYDSYDEEMDSDDYSYDDEYYWKF